jgi:hypothetical protein
MKKSINDITMTSDESPVLVRPYIERQRQQQLKRLYTEKSEIKAQLDEQEKIYEENLRIVSINLPRDIPTISREFIDRLVLELQTTGKTSTRAVYFVSEDYINSYSSISTNTPFKIQSFNPRRYSGGINFINAESSYYAEFIEGHVNNYGHITKNINELYEHKQNAIDKRWLMIQPVITKRINDWKLKLEEKEKEIETLKGLIDGGRIV